jgi:hypothetical protein
MVPKFRKDSRRKGTSNSKNSTLWTTKLCNPFKVNWHFGAIHRLHLQVEEQAKEQGSMKEVA